MSFLKRLFSSDWRRALAAEAAGDYLEAARAYALAGNRAKVASMHLLRAERASTRGEEMDALRDALRWADEGTEERRAAAKALAQALVARQTAEGIATEKDREVLREAARLYEEAGEHREAGALWEQLHDDEGAARAYEKGGLVDKMELALARDEQRARSARRLKGAFEEYELHMRGGDREAALAAIRLCCDLAETKGDYRRLLAELERRRIATGSLTMRRLPGGPVAVLCGGPKIQLGRQAGCEMLLRAAETSRVHAQISVASASFQLADLQSRHGTWMAGMMIEGSVSLDGTGSFSIGGDTEIAWERRGAVLRLAVARGLDKGVVLLYAMPGASIDLAEPLGLRAQLRFTDGRPYLTVEAGRGLRLNGTRIPRQAAQLVREDVVAVDDVEAEVL